MNKPADVEGGGGCLVFIGVAIVCAGLASWIGWGTAMTVFGVFVVLLGLIAIFG